MSIQNATLIKKGLAFGGTIPDYSSAIGYKESIGDTCKNPNGYTVGSFFVGSNDGYFYKVTSAIAYGDTLTVGTNCEQTSVAYELMNGGGGGGNSGIRYVEEDDMVQLYYNGQWVDWLSPGMSYPIGTEIDFTYSNAIQQFVVPANGTWKVEAYGAKGGDANSSYKGGYGGYSYGNIILHKDDILYICTGQQGSTCSSGGSVGSTYNGGGSATSERDGSNSSYAGSGGGATHVAKSLVGSGVLSEYSSTQNREEILIVAGGGGGGFYDATAGGRNCAGGTGGGTTGGNGGIYQTPQGGTQTTGNAFGVGGGRTGSSFGAGGGGGWYGGYSLFLCAGAGGSGHINETEFVTGTTAMQNGINNDNGYVKFTYVSRNIS